MKVQRLVERERGRNAPISSSLLEEGEMVGSEAGVGGALLCRRCADGVDDEDDEDETAGSGALIIASVPPRENATGGASIILAA